MKLPALLETQLKDVASRLADPSGSETVRAYVNIMMGVMGRGLVSLTRHDPTVQPELEGFPGGFRFEMIVLPDGPSVRLRLNAERSFEPDTAPGKPDLSIQFKHIRHAYLVLSFQEGTVRAFANNRMVVDGDIAWAMRMVRILNRLQSIILPEVVARQAVKRYDPIPVADKARLAAKIYGDVAAMSLKGDAA